MKANLKIFLLLHLFASLLFLLLTSCINRRGLSIGECPLPPEDFSERDLIGEWIAISIKDTDTLIFRNDGKYKQVIHLEIPAVDYESDWLDWDLEYSPEGFHYLHLHGLRICAATPHHDCEWESDGTSNWVDYCRQTTITPPPGEIVLTILGLPEFSTSTSARQFRLVLFFGYESGPWVYSFKD